MTFHKNKKTCKSETYKFNSVPGTGFEPAQPFGCCDLNTVRLPISPPGLLTGSKDKTNCHFTKAKWIYDSFFPFQIRNLYPQTLT